jgi:hypothetical protein
MGIDRVKIILSEHVREDCLHGQRTERKTLERINKLEVQPG